MTAEAIIYAIGIGPGHINGMTLKAFDTIKQCEAIIGYSAYIQQISVLLDNKIVYDNGMGKEKERCQKAIDLALQGKRVGMVCSGDSGLYGMAGLLYELLETQNLLDQVDMEVIPGVTSALSCSALLGAPIVEDFCTISLSDYMTPYETILKRIEYSAKADFTIALYNPRSLKRPDYLYEVLELIRKERDGDTPVGIVKNAGRNGQEITRTTLDRVPVEWVDMFSTVIIGNTKTKWLGDYMVTSRGYEL
jgi:precorrin-3B C17-methyltransferase